MKRLASIAIAVTIAGVAIPAIAADEPGRSGDPASAEKRPPESPSTVNEGPASQEPGRSGDPASAEKRPYDAQSVKPQGPPSQEPGRTGDPASAEKRK